METVMEQSDKEVVEPKKFVKRQQKRKACAFCVEGAKEIVLRET